MRRAEPVDCRRRNGVDGEREEHADGQGQNRDQRARYVQQKDEDHQAHDEHLFDEEDATLSNILDVHIYNLRKKLGADFIVTRRGHGYCIE